MPKRTAQAKVSAPRTSPYLRTPSIARDTIIFVHDDDLWRVPTSGGEAIRLTRSNGPCSRPCLSPDASKVAFTLNVSGQHDIYLMDARGGEAERLTYLDNSAAAIRWQNDDSLWVRSSHAFLPLSLDEIFSIHLQQREFFGWDEFD